MSDIAEEIEHPMVPLGINRMAIPRAAILLSMAMAAMILVSTIIVGYSVWKFTDINQDAFDAADRSLIQDPEAIDGTGRLLFCTTLAPLDSTTGTGRMFLQTRMICFYSLEKCDAIGSIRDKEIGHPWWYIIEEINRLIWSWR